MTDDIQHRLKKALDNPRCIIPHEHLLTLLIHELTYNLPQPTFSPQVPLVIGLLKKNFQLMH